MQEGRNSLIFQETLILKPSYNVKKNFSYFIFVEQISLYVIWILFPSKQPVPNAYLKLTWLYLIQAKAWLISGFLIEVEAPNKLPQSIYLHRWFWCLEFIFSLFLFFGALSSSFLAITFNLIRLMLTCVLSIYAVWSTSDFVEFHLADDATPRFLNRFLNYQEKILAPFHRMKINNLSWIGELIFGNNLFNNNNRSNIEFQLSAIHDSQVPYAKYEPVELHKITEKDSSESPHQSENHPQERISDRKSIDYNDFLRCQCRMPKIKISNNFFTKPDNDSKTAQKILFFLIETRFDEDLGNLVEEEIYQSSQNFGSFHSLLDFYQNNYLTFEFPQLKDKFPEVPAILHASAKSVEMSLKIKKISIFLESLFKEPSLVTQQLLDFLEIKGPAKEPFLAYKKYLYDLKETKLKKEGSKEKTIMHRSDTKEHKQKKSHHKVTFAVYPQYFVKDKTTNVFYFKISMLSVKNNQTKDWEIQKRIGEFKELESNLKEFFGKDSFASSLKISQKDDNKNLQNMGDFLLSILQKEKYHCEELFSFIDYDSDKRCHAGSRTPSDDSDNSIELENGPPQPLTITVEAIMNCVTDNETEEVLCFELKTFQEIKGIGIKEGYMIKSLDEILQLHGNVYKSITNSNILPDFPDKSLKSYVQLKEAFDKYFEKFTQNEELKDNKNVVKFFYLSEKDLEKYIITQDRQRVILDFKKKKPVENFKISQ